MFSFSCELRCNSTIRYESPRSFLLQFHRERPPYNLKEQKLGRFLIDLLTISKTSSDAERLLNFKAPKGGGAKGDFASTVFHVLQSRGSCPSASGMSVADVNLQLDAFAKSQQDGAQGKVRSRVRSAGLNRFLFLCQLYLHGLINPLSDQAYILHGTLFSVCDRALQRRNSARFFRSCREGT